MKNFQNIDLEALKQGRYESVILRVDNPDAKNRFARERNNLRSAGLFSRPVADEHFLDNGGEKPAWPSGKKFAVCLTHDVDNVSRYSIHQALRRTGKYPVRAGTVLSWISNMFRSGIDLTRAVINGGSKDPLHCYEEWLHAEEKVDARSTFFFWPGKENVKRPHHTDCLYNLSDTIVFDGRKCSVSEMMREIDRRGWEIGLHASWYSFDDVSEMKRQKEVIEKVLGHDIVSVRQHYLHYDIKTTPMVQEEAKFKYDSTLGFNCDTGFRFGTSYPWNIYDLEKESPCSVIEVPLIIQEGALLRDKRGLGLNEDEAFKRVTILAKSVEKVGGVLTLLWHPNHIIRSNWWNLYLRVLEYLREKDPWFATISETGEWWYKNGMK